MASCEICETFKNTYFGEILSTTNSKWRVVNWSTLLPTGQDNQKSLSTGEFRFSLAEMRLVHYESNIGRYCGYCNMII